MMEAKGDKVDYSTFILERSKRLAKDAAARLEAIEDLYEMIQSAKKDYQNKIKLKHATVSKS